MGRSGTSPAAHPAVASLQIDHVCAQESLGHTAHVARGEPTGWGRRLLADPARRSLLATVAVIAGLVLQVINLLDVFDGAPAWVWVAVFTAYVLILGVVLTVAYLNIRDARAGRKR